jgi:hypothetical protein
MTPDKQARRGTMRKNHWKTMGVVIVAAMSFMAVGCRSGIKGTYSSTSGTMMLELRSGGKASFTMMGETRDCTYKVDGKDIPLTCGNNTLDFHVMDDGSLTSKSPFLGATFGVLRKTK